MLSDFNAITVELPSCVWVRSPDQRLLLWIPRRDSQAHYATRPHYARVIPDGPPTVVKMNAQDLDVDDMADIRTAIKNLHATAAQRHPNMTAEFLQTQMKENVHWGFKPLGTPVIEAVTWEKVASKCQFHSIGISFHESSGDTRTGQDKLRKIAYTDGSGKDRQFQGHPRARRCRCAAQRCCPPQGVTAHTGPRLAAQSLHHQLHCREPVRTPERVQEQQQPRRGR